MGEAVVFDPEIPLDLRQSVLARCTSVLRKAADGRLLDTSDRQLLEVMANSFDKASARSMN